MKTIQVEPLTTERFLPFGRYASMIEPKGNSLGDPPIQFFGDMLQVDLGGNETLPSFGVCRCSPRELIIDQAEHHNRTCEVMLPIDQDVWVQLAPANAGAAPDFEKFRVFLVPKGTLLSLRPGVWHHAPFTIGKTPANVLIQLPERTYINDAICYTFSETERIQVNP